ncbi:MAG: chemotaxis protein CheA, partial [Actinomycetota bacterium]|nr:chemotaxis protein CheA [Actinomycetota bacterium]
VLPVPESVSSDRQDGSPMRAGGRRTEIPKLSETQTVRIAMGHLDTMVDLVGELVILRSRLDRMADELEIRELSDTVEELHRISEELQHEVMNTRMVPVGNIFNRFPRMVRDLAQDLGKEVSFSMEGLDIELDRTVLDEIGDPIVHLLRNSIDHGIELPEDREKSGKSARGAVTLSARRERDTVRIAVCDDGRGMDIERIWDKACTLGISRPEEREGYRDEDVLLLTCTPGFSTAAHATRVSGRGVGMDVVRGKIEHLGGSLEIRSRFGSGTEIEMTLPLTLAIIQALLVSTAGQTFALPLGAVDEVLDPGEISIGTIDGASVLIGREGMVVPLVRLDVTLGMAEPTGAPPALGEHIVLMQDAAGAPRGLVVGGLHGRTEVVIKPLTRLVRDAHGIGGATVLGDGRVALILDTRTIFREGVVDR